MTARLARPPWPDRCAVTRLARDWRRRRGAPRCAKLRPARRTRALTPSWPRPAPVGAPCCAHGAVRLQACEAGTTTARSGMAGLMCCTGGKSHGPNAPRTGTSASVKGVGRRNVLPGQDALSPSWRAASAGRASSSAWCRSQIPAADRDIVLLRCCILLLYKALERLAQDFEFIYLTWGGATGIRTPDLLHAMQVRPVAGCGWKWLYQQLQSPHVAGYGPLLPPACSPSCSPCCRRRSNSAPRAALGPLPRVRGARHDHHMVHRYVVTAERGR
jgi:hypothetical protein